MATPARALLTPAQATAEALGGAKLLGRIVRTGDDLTALIRQGLPAASVRGLAGRLALDHRAAAQAFGIAPRTFSRRLSSRSRLTPAESDRAARLARVFTIAVATIGDEAKAVTWLRSENRALRGARPLDQLDTDPGAIGVEDVLGRIAYGGYS